MLNSRLCGHSSALMNAILRDRVRLINCIIPPARAYRFNIISYYYYLYVYTYKSIAGHYARARHRALIVAADYLYRKGIIIIDVHLYIIYNVVKLNAFRFKHIIIVCVCSVSFFVSLVCYADTRLLPKSIRIRPAERRETIFRDLSIKFNLLAIVKYKPHKVIT